MVDLTVGELAEALELFEYIVILFLVVLVVVLELAIPISLHFRQLQQG